MLSGETPVLGGSMALFLLAVGIFLLAMAGFRTPVIALMPDLTPSPLRSEANGVINLMGGLGGVVITLVGAWLYGIDIALPFIVAGVLMAAAVLMLVFFVHEQRQVIYAPDEREEVQLQALARSAPHLARGPT